MLNQVEMWKQKGISAAAILQAKEMDPAVLSGIQHGMFSLLFAFPEVMTQSRWLDMAKTYRKALVTIACDEVHCLVQ